jgi:SAM-dependent methyltransferase
MASAPSFATRDSRDAAFWDERFAAGFMPWDAGAVPPRLAAWLAANRGGGARRVLIPGCGSGYEAAAFEDAGFATLAIDYSAQAIAQATATLGAERAARLLREADFFKLAEPAFDLIYERAFVIALPPARWPDWARRTHELLVPGGLLLGFFLFDENPAEPRRGPPFAQRRVELERLLAAGFDSQTDGPVPEAESLPIFAGRERYMIWRRR